MGAFDYLRVPHEPLGIAPVYDLGRLHWLLLDAANRWNAARSKPVNKMPGTSFVQYEKTEFGSEVGKDEIYWWVFTKETNLEALRTETTTALAACQNLKQAAEKLRHVPLQKYDDLIGALADFAIAHRAQITTILKYASFLSDRNDFLPALLFTYRVWGDTRRGERWIDLAAPKLEDETERSLQQYGEVVLGLSTRFGPAVFKAEYEIGADRYEGAMESGSDIVITEQEIVRRASHYAFDDCAEYFTELRDSLRNILLDIEKCSALRNKVDDESFWRRFISTVVATNQTETEYWEFKEVLPLWLAKGTAKDLERVAFSELVAGMANWKGGVIVVGVRDDKKIVGLEMAALEDRLKFTRSVLSAHLLYGRELVTMKQVTVEAQGQSKTCLAIIVAQASEVVGVDDGKGRFSYPVRQETGVHRPNPRDLALKRVHLKTDNHDFLNAIEQFVLDNRA